MPSWCSRTCCGLTSAPGILRPLWRNTRGGSGASGRVLADPHSAPSSVGASRWSDLSRRVLSALVLLAVALLCVWAGGYAFLLLVVAASVVLASEWLTMCGYGMP